MTPWSEVTADHGMGVRYLVPRFRIPSTHRSHVTAPSGT
jgi:hypothetical protein